MADAGAPLVASLAAREPGRDDQAQAAIDEGHDADVPSNMGLAAGDAHPKQRGAGKEEGGGSEANGADLERQASSRSEQGDKETVRVTAGDDASDDENTIWWDGDDDPQNPYNWPRWVKVLNCILISSLTFVTPLASSMFAPGVPALMREFGSASPELGSFCVSVYVLGFAAGPMVFAPLSELYGRPRVYNVANVGFIAFIVACAKAPSLGALIAFRFLSGVFGSCPVTNGGGSIADMFVQEKRGAAMATFAVGPLLGPIVGPAVGGVVSDALGWRWVFWVIAAVSGALSLCFLFLGRETYAPVILQRRVDRLSRETGNGMLRSGLDPGLAPRDYFRRGILRPFKMLLFSPICIVCGVYVGLAYAYLYLLFTSLTPLFMRVYRFDTVHAGLTFLGLGVGSMIGVAYFSVASDRHMRNKAAREEAAAATGDGGGAGGRRRFKPTIKPEYRLPPLKVGAVLLPAGFFVYGWTAEYRVHWIAPIVGTAIIGVGNLIVFMSLQLYLVDSFSIYAASALAANAVVRSVAGAVLPLAGIPMYDKLGLGWGNSLLGFIAMIMLPAPWLFIKHGEYLRKRFEIKNL